MKHRRGVCGHLRGCYKGTDAHLDRYGRRFLVGDKDGQVVNVDRVGVLFKGCRRKDVVTVFAVKPAIAEKNFVSADVQAEDADFPDPDIRFQTFVCHLYRNLHDRRRTFDQFLFGQVGSDVFHVYMIGQCVRAGLGDAASGGRACQYQFLSGRDKGR